MSDPTSTGDTRSSHDDASAGQGDAAEQTFQFARCPCCQAVFRVGRSKLAMRHGDVRCGSCREVFNAYSCEVRKNALGLFDRAETHTDAAETESGQSFDSNLTSNQQPSVQQILNQNLETLEAARQSPESAAEDGDVAGEIWNEPALPDSPAPAPKGLVFIEADGPVLPLKNADTDSGIHTEPDNHQGEAGQSASPEDTEQQPDEVEDIQQAGEEPAAGSQTLTDEPQPNSNQVENNQQAESTEGGTVEQGPRRQHWFNAEPDPLLDNNPFAVKPGRESSEQNGVAEAESVTRSSQFNIQGVDHYIKDRSNPLVTVFWTLVAAAFVLLLGLQVKYYFVERFAQDERYRPYLSGFCKVANCELPPRRDSYRFTITNTRIDLHPSEPGALRVTVKLLNQADFSQPYPDLQLTLTDRLGRVVGRRSFKPSFYLEDGRSNLLDSADLETVVFDLARPHEKAVGFVVDIVRSPGNV